MRLVLIGIGMYMIWGYPALATNTTKASRTSQSTSQVKILPPQEKLFLFSIDLSASSNLKDTADADYAASTALMLSALVQINNSLRAGAAIGVEKKMYGEQDSQLTNLELNLKLKPIDFTGGRAMNFAAVGVLPTNETDRVEKTFRGATGGSIGLSQKYALASKEGFVSYAFSGLKNYHEFDRTNEAAANLSYRFRHILSLTQELFGVVSIALLGRYQFGHTYQNAFRTVFLLEEKINFAISPEISFYISHTNDGDALKPNGVDSNINAYDKATSTFSTGLTANF